MIALAMVLAAAALLVSVVTAFALVEAYERLELLGAVGNEPKLIPFEIPHLLGKYPSDFGLPHALASEENGILLVLSPTCVACHHIAKELGGEVPAGMHILVTNAPNEVSRAWMSEYSVPDFDVTVDSGRLIADQMAVDTTPVALLIEAGRFAGGTIVSSMSGLKALVDQFPRQGVSNS